MYKDVGEITNLLTIRDLAQPFSLKTNIAGLHKSQYQA